MPSILIIDDDVTILARMAAQFEEAGFTVARSSDLRHGEQLYSEQRPDMVILEVRAGGGQGWELLGRLAAETPVLVVSAASREEDVVRALEEGAVDHLAKPYRSVELMARVRLRMAVPVAAPLAPVSLAPPAPPAAVRSKGAQATPAARPGPAPSSPAPTAPVAASAPPAAPDAPGAAPTTPLAAPPAAPEPPGPAPAPAAATPARLPPVSAPAGADLSAEDAVAAHRAARRKHPRGAPTVDESVFMSEAEEMALLRTPPAPPEHAAGARPAPADAAPAPDVGDGGLGRRMRAERQRRHLTLVQLENELKIRMSYLQAMEDEKLTLLPRGPAAPQMLKDYADYLGLDAAEALEELRSQNYGEVVTPLPALGGTRVPRAAPRWAIILAAVLLALAVGVGAILLFDPGFFMRLPEYLPRLTLGG